MRPPRREGRGYLGLLLDRQFGPFFAGRLSGATGVWIHNIAATILVFTATGSAWQVGLVTTAQFAPYFLLAAASGRLADQRSRRAQMIWGRLVTTVASTAMAVWVIAEPPPQLLVAALLTTSTVVGIGNVLGGPAIGAVIPDLVADSEVTDAVSLNNAAATAARALGPGLASMLALTLGPEFAFAAAAAGNLVFAAILVVMAFPDHARASGSDTFLHAVRAVRRRPDVVTALLAIAAVGVTVDPVITLGPSLATAVGGDVHLAGTLGSAFGVGAGLAYVCLSPLQRAAGLVASSAVGLLAIAAAMFVMASTFTHYPPAVAVIACAVAGGGMTLTVTSATSMVISSVEPLERGRIMALWSLAFMGSRPVGATLNGAVADVAALEAAFLLAGVMAVLGGIAMWRCAPPPDLDAATRLD